ncbi:MAG: hypothetical protein J6A23_04225 [Thermoguttaceae bacterium]|nr:hypothetical protein [Thermoguttaceae bacterium]
MLTFRAERPISEEDGRLAFQLPQKLDDEMTQVVFTSTPAELRILSASNLELNPVLRECRRLVRQPLPLAEVRQAASASSILLYRSEGGDSLFTADFKVHERHVQVKQRSRVEVYAQQYRVHQTFDYAAAYESLSQLRFLVPEMDLAGLSVQVSSSPSAGQTGGEGRYLAMKSVLRTSGNGTENAGKSLVPSADSLGHSLNGNGAANGTGNGTGNGTANGNISGTVNGQRTGSGDEGGQGKSVSRTGSDVPDGGNSPILKFGGNSVRHQFMEIEAVLPEKRIGTFTVTISYALPMPKLSAEEKRLVEIRLASSEDGATVENILELASENGVELMSPSELDFETPWEDMGAFLAQDPLNREPEWSERPGNLMPEFFCRSFCAQNDFQVNVKLRPISTQKVTVVDRCWIQTWLTKEARQDRAVFLFPPLQESGISEPGQRGAFIPPRTLTVRLPHDVQMESVRVWIDGKPAAGNQVKKIQPEQLQITFSSPNVFQAQTVEVFCQYPAGKGLGHFLNAEIPYVQEAAWVRGLFWQLIVPQDVHLLKVPSNFTMEYRWGWGHCFLGRMPLWEQETLEKWSGAVRGTPAPAQMNRYVLSGMGNLRMMDSEIPLIFADRTAIVGVLGVCVLILGSLFLVLKLYRSFLAQFLFWVVLGSLAVRFPDYAVLCAQAGVLGFLAIFVSMMCGLRKNLRHKMNVDLPSDDQTVHHAPAIQTMVALSEDSRHAFKTVTFEQNMGISDANFSTVIRKN